jgi:glycosyltransferase involved in cell wall biosynthesis
VQDQPLVSVIVPVYNGVAYLEKTIQSILSQDYPFIECIVMDGGSTDGTTRILERYKDRLVYLSKRDGGAADAINQGFAIAHGSVLAWLNADDTYLAGALSEVMAQFASSPDVAIVYGDAYWVDSESAILGPYPECVVNPEALGQGCCVCQPACFFKREVFESVGPLDSGLHFAFDYDLWIRMAKRYSFRHLPVHLATARMHKLSKTFRDRRNAFREAFTVLKRHYSYVPFQWIHSYASHLVDNRDQFFEPLRPSLLKYAISLPLGCFHNWRHMRRYWKEWRRVMTRAALRRRVNEGWLAKALQGGRRKSQSVHDGLSGSQEPNVVSPIRNKSRAS